MTATSRSSPASRACGLEFVNAIKGGSIPGGFIPAVEKGISEQMAKGVLAGYPVKDVRVRLFDGQYHTVDSSEMAFKIAGSMAFKDAAAKAEAYLLEPIVEMTIIDARGHCRRRDRRSQLAPRAPARHGAEGLDDRDQGRGADG